MSYRHCSASTPPICTRRSVQWALGTARFLPTPVSRYFPIRSNRSASCAATCLHSVARLRKFIPCPRQILLSLSVWISPNQSGQAPLNPGLLNARARIDKQKSADEQIIGAFLFGVGVSDRYLPPAFLSSSATNRMSRKSSALTLLADGSFSTISASTASMPFRLT